MPLSSGMACLVENAWAGHLPYVGSASTLFCPLEVLPHLVLPGHRSIVNQVRYSPVHRLMCSSGVEKVIKVSFPIPRPPSVIKVRHQGQFPHPRPPSVIKVSFPIPRPPSVIKVSFPIPRPPSGIKVSFPIPRPPSVIYVAVS